MKRQERIVGHADLQRYRPVRRDRFMLVIVVMTSVDATFVFRGVLLVQMLNMLDPFDLISLGRGSAKAFLLMIEAQKRAYADRASHLGDIDFLPVPLDRLIAKNYASDRLADFSASSVTPSAEIWPGQWPAESTETTHYSLIEKAGNAEAVTTTLKSGYGKKIVVSGQVFS